jgi:hypothetical protein
MKKFRQYFLETVTIGLTEYIEIDGIGRVKAKIDSGNQGYNVLHGTNITEIDENKVKFQTVGDKTVSFEKRGDIQIYAGKSDETRPVIYLNIKMGNQFYQDVPFSITDRSENDEPVLIGEPFLKKIHALIDVNKAHLQEKSKRGAQRGPLISDRYIPPAEVYADLVRQEQMIVKQLQEFPETEFYDPEQAILHSKLHAIQAKIEKMKPVSREFAAKEFPKIRNAILK